MADCISRVVKQMTYEVGFQAFCNYPTFTDSFSIVTIQYVVQGLCDCNIISCQLTVQVK